MTSPSIKTDKSWHSMEIEEVLQALESSHQGLGSEEAELRLKKFGPNELQEEKKISPLKIFIEQFKQVLIIILLFAVFLSVLIGEVVDALVILAIVIVATLLGFAQEYRAERAIEALKKMAAPTATVLRDHGENDIPARELVPGDIILLKTGDRVPADSRIIEATNLKIDEALLTGESIPVTKETKVILDDAPVVERKNIAFGGTVVTYGHGKAIVTSTGMNTVFGNIARSIQTTEKPTTPLEIKMRYVGKQLGFIFIAVSLFVILLGALRGGELLTMFMLGIALAVAAVPEALPAVITMGLATGVRRMAKRNAIVRKLSAVETLGSTTIICSDKTGTMTKNEMTVREIYVNGKVIQVSGVGYEPVGDFRIGDDLIEKEEHPNLILKAMVLCNDAQLKNEKNSWYILGDPTEGALLVAAAKARIMQDEIKSQYPRIGEVPFSSERKRMTTIHPTQEGKVAYVKGAPEVVLELCTHVYKDNKAVKLSEEEKMEILKVNEKMAGKALRVLGFAYRDLPNDTREFSEEDEKNLTFIGLVGMIDPPREEAKMALRLCEEAHIKVVMITGDHKLTAIAVAEELGMMKKESKVLTGTELDKINDEDFGKIVEDVAVYARVSPEHKLRIVKALKKKGHIVAMTGDGVNDAPALKSSDIGVAMGITGTDVTREASDMVLADDNFATIVSAVEEGRRIYDNIKKYLAYLLPANIGEVMIFLMASLFGLPLPLTVVQILWINLATDGLPAIALSADPAEPYIMRRPPRNPQENPFHGLRVFLIGFPLIMTFWAILILVLQSDGGLLKAHAMIFSILIMIELFASFSCRSVRYPVYKIGVLSNKYLIVAIAWEITMLSILLYVPFFNPLFNTIPLSLLDWSIVLLAAITAFAYLELSKWLKMRKES